MTAPTERCKRWPTSAPPPAAPARPCCLASRFPPGHHAIDCTARGHAPAPASRPPGVPMLRWPPPSPPGVTQAMTPAAVDPLAAADPEVKAWLDAYEPTGVVNLPPAELGAFALRVLAASAFDACDGLFWRTDGKYAPLWISAKCSDCFAWGIAESEPITPANIDTFERAMADCAGADGGDTSFGPYLFAARVRRQVPMPAFLAILTPPLRVLFESASQEP